MLVNGTLINYYLHCKRQCYLHGNRLNLEDNSERVHIGRAIHEEKEEQLADTEISIDNIKLDGLTSNYLVEIKKSDADIEACKWQLLFYLKILKDKGIIRKGRLEFIEKKKQSRKIIYIDLTEENERKLLQYIKDIEELLENDIVPDVLNSSSCKKCAYYEYCYI